MPFKTLRSVAGIYKQLGCLDGTLSLVSSLVQRVTRGYARLHKYRFIAQPVASRPWLPAHRGAGIEVHELDASDPLLKEFPRPDWVMPYRFGQGAICLAAFKDARCAGFLWLVVGPYAEDEVRCRYVPEGQASWDFDLYIYPEYRNSLVFLRLWDEANRYLAARGVRWSLSRVSAFNAGSLASHARMGAKRIGTAVFLCAGSWQLFAGTVSPYFRVSWSADTFPTLALRA
jgi:hypothetical protein